jgi:hypothetical protein
MTAAAARAAATVPSAATPSPVEPAHAPPSPDHAHHELAVASAEAAEARAAVPIRDGADTGGDAQECVLTLSQADDAGYPDYCRVADGQGNVLHYGKRCKRQQSMQRPKQIAEDSWKKARKITRDDRDNRFGQE